MTLTADPATVPLTDEQRELLLRHHTFPAWCVHKFFPHLRGDEIEEAIAVAAFGMVRAAQRFDPALGKRFTTYAAWWCRQAVQHWRGKEQRRGFRWITPAAMAPLVSLDAASEDLSVRGLLEARDPDPSDAAASGLDAVSAVAAAVRLTPPQGRVLACMYLDGLSRGETAERLGITRRAVADAQTRGVRRLREAL